VGFYQTTLIYRMNYEFSPRWTFTGEMALCDYDMRRLRRTLTYLLTQGDFLSMDFRPRGEVIMSVVLLSPPRSVRNARKANGGYDNDGE